MKILMFTNTYLPHVGGVARSVQSFSEKFRELGHEVLIVAPEFDEESEELDNVIRVPAIQNFNGSDFSVRLPVSPALLEPVVEFEPDIVHSHHPFLLGDTALRIARSLHLPIVFTHHTLYERYTHYVPGDSVMLQQFAIQLATSYANLCHAVIAPSESIKQLIERRGVEVEVRAIATGIDQSRFKNGDGARARKELTIPEKAYVVGHLGRLAPEKNLPFLAECTAEFIAKDENRHCLIVGSGPSEEEISKIFEARGVASRLHLPGTRNGQELVDCYHAMNVFAFASKTETQGMVLAEAMSCGVPVVALDAPGAREILRDRENGCLVLNESKADYIDALDWISTQTEEQKALLAENSKSIASEFSLTRMAEKMLQLYDELIETNALVADYQDSAWEKTLRLLENEWDLLSGKTKAAGRSFGKAYSVLGKGFYRLQRKYRRVREWCNKAELSVRLLNLPKSEEPKGKPGLVLIQVDGLSRVQFDRAYRFGRMPFLRKLRNKEQHRLLSFYSGVPSTTPAVQGELLYGKRCAVPAFGFYRRDPNDFSQAKYMRMFEPDCAREVEDELVKCGDGLLQDGSSYSIIYSGGAESTHFCPAQFGWGTLLRYSNPLRILGFALFNIWSLFRVTVLLVIEFFLAIIDCFRGLIEGEDFLSELKFIPARIGITILLRELLVVGAVTDVTRGVPVVYMNLLGYDEQAHRRGPGSAFAIWSLKGLDDAIKRVWKAAKRTDSRDYEVWIFSDHGQEYTTPYEKEFGQSVESAIAEVVGGAEPLSTGTGYERQQQLSRARWISSRSPNTPPAEQKQADPDSLFYFAGLGPVGHIYFKQQLDADEQRQIAQRLAHEKGVPLVLLRSADGTVQVFKEEKQLSLARDIDEIAGPDHPFVEELAEDLQTLVEHPDSGDILLLGWRYEKQPLTFSLESGSHGSIGSRETEGFALLPQTAPLPETTAEFIRPEDLRACALEHLTPTRVSKREKIAFTNRPANSSLRVMSYNVHSCIGTDGKHSLKRIAEVLKRYQPDVIALQELDSAKQRSGGGDQAQALAEILGMEYHFHSVFELAGGLYGNAVLSRFPMKRVRSGILPQPEGKRSKEPRGALWTKIEVDGQEVNIVNTHLGLSSRERATQANELLSSAWLGSCSGPTVFCGDLNISRGSPLYRRFTENYKDTQFAAPNHKPRNTWISHMPIRCLDYILVSNHFETDACFIPVGHKEKRASDHLPVLADISFAATEESGD